MDHEQAMNAKIIDRYLLGELPEAERVEFEEHYFSCAECAEELVTAVKFVENARRPLLRLEEDARPVPEWAVRGVQAVVKAPWWDRWLALAPKPALAGLCAALAMVVVWQSSAGRPEAEVTGSYFVTATRSAGAPRKIQVQRGQQRVALLFNHTDPSVTRFSFTLEDAQGRAVQQFTGGAPGDTSDLQVLIPVAGLSSGVYTLRVRNAMAQNEVAALPFELATP